MMTRTPLPAFKRPPTYSGVRACLRASVNTAMRRKASA